MINPSSITYEQTKVRSCHGGAILSEEYLASIQTPSMGVEFELDGIPNVEPPSVEFLTVSFSKLEITPQYLDISTTLEIGIELSIDNYGSESTKISYQPENGKTVDLSDRIQPIKLDLNVESSDDILTGDVKISAMHPDVSDSYRRTFTISKGSVLLEDGFDDQSLNTDLWKIVSNGGSVSENSDGELHLVCQNTDVNTVVRSKNSYSGNLDLKCKVKNDPKADTGGYQTGLYLRNPNTGGYAMIRYDQYAYDNYWETRINDGNGSSDTSENVENNSTGNVTVIEISSK